MGLFGWSTAQLLKASLYIERLVEGRLYRPETLRGLNDAPDVIEFNPPVTEDELRIVHISDLHFGADHPEKRDHVVRLLHQIKPHLIIVSGDIVNTPSPDNFRLAKQYLGLLATHCRHMIVCPGNHDRSGRVNLDEYMNGLDVTRGPYDCQYLDFSDDFRVTAFILNSTPAEVAEPVDTPKPLAEELKRHVEHLVQVRGWVDPAQLQRMRAWRDYLLETKHDAYRDSLKIAVIHHHPLPTSMGTYAEQFMILLNSGEVLDCFMDLGIDIVFHGHQHDPLLQSLRRGTDDQQMYVLSAGTATKASPHGGEERTRSLSKDTGLFVVTHTNDWVRVEQFTYVNAFDLVYKFVPASRLERPWSRRPYLRYKIAQKWVIRWPSMDFVMLDTRTLLARTDDVTRYPYAFGTNTPATFDELGFTVTRERDGHVVAPPRIVDQRTGSTMDAIGDAIDTVMVDLEIDPPVCSARGAADVFTFSYTWPRGFDDLKREGRVQSDLAFAETLDEFSLEIEIQGGIGIKDFIMLPSGSTAAEGLVERVAPNRVLYRKVGVPQGMVFNYQLTRGS